MTVQKAAKVVPVPTLQFAAGALAGQTMRIEEDAVLIGRRSDNDVVIDEPQISRHHARLVRADGALYLEDLASANGTFIDGDRLKGRTLLEAGQTVSFGSYAIRLDLARGHIQRSYRGDILIQ